MDERIISYFLGQLPEEERIRLLKEREISEELKKEFADIQNLQGIMHLSSSFADYEEGEKKYIRIEKEKRKKKLQLTIRKAAGYAAAIAVTFMITWAFKNTQTPFPVAGIPQQELYVPAGQRARITLPDGSTVWLNAGSTLLYPSLFEKERRIELQGEAFFDVAKDPEKAFIVSTGKVEIKALGTQFNVHSYPKTNQVSTILTEGSVLVYPTGEANKGHILSPDQQLLVENGKFTLKTNIDKDELLWKEGIYSFKNEKLGSIIKKLELYFDVEIVVSNPRILEYEYTGKFRQCDGVLEILRIMQKVYRFKIDNNEELNKITLG